MTKPAYVSTDYSFFLSRPFAIPRVRFRRVIKFFQFLLLCLMDEKDFYCGVRDSAIGHRRSLCQEAVECEVFLLIKRAGDGSETVILAD